MTRLLKLVGRVTCYGLGNNRTGISNSKLDLFSFKRERLLHDGKAGSGGGYKPRREGSNGGYQPRREGSNGGYQPRKEGSNGGYQPRKEGSNGGYQLRKEGSNGGYQPRKEGSNGGYQPRKEGSKRDYQPRREGSNRDYQPKKEWNNRGDQPKWEGNNERGQPSQLSTLEQSKGLEKFWGKEVTTSEPGTDLPWGITKEVYEAVLRGQYYLGKPVISNKNDFPFWLPIHKYLLRTMESYPNRKVLLVVPTVAVGKLLEQYLSEELGSSLKVHFLRDGSPSQMFEFHQAQVEIATPLRVFHYLKANLSNSEYTTVCFYQVDKNSTPSFVEEVGEVFSHLKKLETSNDKLHPTQFMVLTNTFPHWLQKLCRVYFDKAKAYIDPRLTHIMECDLPVNQLAIPTLPEQIPSTLCSILEQSKSDGGKFIVLCNSVDRVKEFVEELEALDHIKPTGLFSSLPAHEQERINTEFYSGTINCLVTTNPTLIKFNGDTIQTVIQTHMPKTFTSFWSFIHGVISHTKVNTFITLLNPNDRHLFENVLIKSTLALRVSNLPCPYRDAFFSNLNNANSKELDCSKVYSRSLIDAKVNYATLIITNVSRPATLSELIYRQFKLDPLQANIRQISQTQDGKSLVFDTHFSTVPQILSAYYQLPRPDYTIKVVETLPLLNRSQIQLKSNYRINKSNSKSTSVLVNRYINNSTPSHEFNLTATDNFTTWNSRSDFNKKSKKSRGNPIL